MSLFPLPGLSNKTKMSSQNSGTSQNFSHYYAKVHKINKTPTNKIIQKVEPKGKMLLPWKTQKEKQGWKAS